ncbi:spermidine/spermine synthases, partial [Kipferlia bialata]
DIMTRFGELTGRKYAPFVYHGHPEAERVIIHMGCNTHVTEGVVKGLAARGEKVGMVRVHLFRPFSAEMLVECIPKTVTDICVLDRSKEIGAGGEPLYLDVLAALHSTGRLAGMRSVVGGRAGLCGAELYPSSVQACLTNLAQEKPRNKFIVGINDDVYNTSLALEGPVPFSILHEDTSEALLFGLGADGTVGAARNAISIISDTTPLHTQAFFEFDGKKSGGITQSYLRFGPEPIRAQYAIEEAGYVACHATSYINRYAHRLLRRAKKGAVFVVNAKWSSIEEAAAHMPGSLKKVIAEKEIKLHVVDAYAMAQSVGLGQIINTIMLMFFFKHAVGALVPFETVTQQMKDLSAKLYSKRGEKVVQANVNAIDAACAVVEKCEMTYPAAEWAQCVPEAPMRIEGAPDVFNDVFVPAILMEGDSIPVSKCMQFIRGTFPAGMSKYEKLKAGVKVPQWNSAGCVQCNSCSVVCPHGSIRPFLVKKDETPADSLPADFGMIPFKGKLPSSLAEDKTNVMFRVQVSPDDCRGCGVCVTSCIGKNALEMVEADAASRQVELWDTALSLPKKAEHFKEGSSIKDIQFREPYFEFPGSCPGCPSSSYVRLLTQLYGERMLLASAVGCILVYGHFNYLRPYSTDDKGRGPAVACSLFEDNAEFGWGIAVGSDAKREQLQTFVKASLASEDHGASPAMADALTTWLAASDAEESRKTADAVQSHVAIHTWPERKAVTLDVYVCNFNDDNSSKAEAVFSSLVSAFAPGTQQVNRVMRGEEGKKENALLQTVGTAEHYSADSDVVFEYIGEHAGYGFTTTQQLARVQSPYQLCEVFETQQFGKVFRLDGRLMTSEREEFFYHECMNHPAALCHPEPKSVLIVGGGDGGSAEELLKHPSIERIVMAELDEVVLDVSREHFEAVHHGSLDDPRVEVIIGDGFEYVKNTEERFDFIILDLTDPDTPAFALYSQEFFAMCRDILTHNGIMSMHLGSPVFEPEVVRKNADAMREVFTHVCPMSLYIPLYGSLWCLCTGSMTLNPGAMSASTVEQKIAERGIDRLNWYNPKSHEALFALPTFVARCTDPRDKVEEKPAVSALTPDQMAVYQAKVAEYSASLLKEMTQ